MPSGNIKIGAPVLGGSSVAAGDGITTAAPAPGDGILEISVSVATSTVVQIGVNDGTGETLIDLNGSVGLVAGADYLFERVANAGWLYRLVNKSGETDTAINEASLQLRSEAAS